MASRNIGSTFDDWLREEGLYEQTYAVAIKRVLARQIAQEMADQKLSKSDLAKRMQTSRVDLERLLDPENSVIARTPSSKPRQPSAAKSILSCSRPAESAPATSSKFDASSKHSPTSDRSEVAMEKARKTAVPRSMQVQLARLFGNESAIAKASERSDREWKRDLRRTLGEIWNYLDENVETDPVHRSMLDSGFMSASEALNHEEFWPGYCEGITRILLCLLGTYPDHRKRKLNGKKKSHYDLRNDRTLQYSRNREQRLHRLCWTAPGILDLGSIPTQLLRKFRDEVGSEAPVTEFLTWFKQHFAEDYLKVF